MKKNIYIIIILIILGIVVFLFLSLNKKEIVPKEGNNIEIVGGDKDENGCIGSAGYSWCEVKNKCLRIWEEKCEVENEITPNAGNMNQNICESKGGVWYLVDNICEKNSLSKDSCISEGGEFNECASACRHDPNAEVCTMQCVVTCTLR